MWPMEPCTLSQLKQTDGLQAHNMAALSSASCLVLFASCGLKQFFLKKKNCVHVLLLVKIISWFALSSRCPVAWKQPQDVVNKSDEDFEDDLLTRGLATVGTHTHARSSVYFILRHLSRAIHEYLMRKFFEVPGPNHKHWASNPFSSISADLASTHCRRWQRNAFNVVKKRWHLQRGNTPRKLEGNDSSIYRRWMGIFLVRMRCRSKIWTGPKAYGIRHDRRP